LDEVPDLVELDHGGTPARLRLGAMIPSMTPDPTHHTLRRDAQALADRVDRQARTVEAHRLALEGYWLAAWLGAGERPAAALAAPALPPAGVTRSDQFRAGAYRAGIRTFCHRSLHRAHLPARAR